MGLDLTNQYIDETFQKLVQVSGSNLTDGTGSVITNLEVTASNADFALTANQAVTATFANTSTSASYALTASFALNVTDPTWDNITDKPAGLVSGSSQVVLADATGDLDGGRITGTVANATNSVSSSYAVSADSSLTSNTSISSSHSLVADTSISSSYALTASYALSAEADNITFDDTQFAYTASNVQIALDKLSANKADISQLSSNVTTFPTNTAADVGGYFALVTSSVDVRYNDPAVDIPTGGITGTGQLIASLVTDSYLFLGDPGIVNLNTNGQIRKVAGSGEATFYYEVYSRSGSVETLLTTSDNTPPVTSTVYSEFSAAAILNNGTFTEDDRIVLKFYANRVPGGSTPSYQFQFGGETPVRTLFPVPASVLISPWNGEFTGDAIITGTLNVTDSITTDTITATTAFFTSASIGHLKQVTGSAVIVGEQYIILNADSPVSRFAGLQVYDSGSATTGSFEWDSVDDNWIQVKTNGQSGGILTGVHGVKGAEAYPTNNKLTKGTGTESITESTITDTGTAISTTVGITAPSFTGSLSGNALTATSASYATLADNLTSGNKTINGSLTVNGGIDIDGTITPTQGGGLDLLQYNLGLGEQPGHVRFYSGSTKGSNYINMQNEPFGNGRVTISSFPTNNHFIFFDPKDGGVGNHRTYIESIVEGGSGGGALRVGAGLQVTGSANINGNFNSTFTAPPSSTQYEFFSPQGCNILGQAYSNVWFGMGDYGGVDFSDYFSIEYYDSFGYNFGGELNINGRQAKFANIPNGGGFGQIAEVGTRDVGDGTSLAFIKGSKLQVGSTQTTEIKLQGRTIGIMPTLTEVVGGASNVDFSKGNFFVLSMTGDSTLTPINLDNTNGVGQTVSVRVITNGNTLSFGANVRWQDGTAPTITGTSVITFVTFGGDNVAYATAVTNLS